MKGLLLKDYYLLFKYSKTYLLYIILFGVISIWTGSSSLFAGMAAVFLTTIPLTGFSLDDNAGWPRMAAASPVSRRTVVRSKYLLVLILLGGALTLAVAMVLLAKLFHPAADLVDGIATVVASILVMGLGVLVLLPIIFKHGAEKGRVAILLIYGMIFGGMLAVGLLVDLIPQAQLARVQGGVVAAIFLSLPLLLAGGIVLSYKISVRAYSRKEL